MVISATPANNLKVDAGGYGYVSASDGTFLSDELFDSGDRTIWAAGTVENTNDPNLYLDARYGPSFSYYVPCAAGNYQVKLYFMNGQSTSDVRVFNVNLNGTRWLSNLDIAATVGSYSAVPSGSPPGAPGRLQATGINHAVNLSWLPPSGATSFSVKRSVTTGGPYSMIASNLDGPAFQDAPLTNGTTYFYVVNATNAVGVSSDSSEVRATPSSNAPTGLSAVCENGAALLTWSGRSGALRYIVKRSVNNSEGPYITISTTVDGPAFEDIGLTNGIKYYYSVAAFFTSGTGDESNVVVAIPYSPLPGAPTGLCIVNRDRNCLLTWSGVYGAKSYRLKRSITRGGPYTTVVSNIDGPACQDIGLTNGTSYYYVVVAVNDAGEGPQSAEITGFPH